MRDDTTTLEPPFPDDPGPHDNVAHNAPSSYIHAAEKALLGAILTEPARAAALRDHVQPTDFDQPRNELIWSTIYKVLDHGILPDAIAVAAQITTDHTLKPTGGHLYLHECMRACPSPDNALTYATTIRDASRIRAVAQVGTKLSALAQSATVETVDRALDHAFQALDEATARMGPSTGPTSNVNYVPMNGLFSRPRTPTQWVIAPILAVGRVSLLYAPGKTGKSLVAMEAAAAIATGRAALATDTPADPQHVLYIDQEMTEEDWIDRLTEMGYGLDDEQLLSEHLHLAQLQPWPAMDTAAGGHAVEAAAFRTKARVVIIDTASKVLEGEENSNDTQQAFYRHTLVPLKRAGIAVLVLDHTGKDLDRGARGGSAKTDNIDLAFELLKRGRDLLTLRCTHSRIRSDLLDDPTFLRRTAGPLSHQIEAMPTIGTTGPGLRPTHLMEMVSRYVEANPGASKTQIETAVKGRVEYIRLALDLLVQEVWIRVERGTRNVQAHHQVKAYREDEDTYE